MKVILNRRISAWGLLVLVLFAVVCSGEPKGGKKKKSWDDEFLRDLEKEWEKGDKEEDIITDYQIKMKEQEERKKNAPAFDPNNIEAYLKAGGGQPTGPVMMFVDLLPEPTKRTTAEVDQLASVWKSMLATGGLLVQAYNIQDEKVLISVDKGWEAIEVKNFLVKQSEVDFVTYNSQKYYPEGRSDPDRDKPKPHVQPPKDKKKKNKKKKKEPATADL